MEAGQLPVWESSHTPPITTMVTITPIGTLLMTQMPVPRQGVRGDTLHKYPLLL